MNSTGGAMVVLSALDQRPRGRRFESDGCGLGCRVATVGQFSGVAGWGSRGPEPPPPQPPWIVHVNCANPTRIFFGKGWRVGVVTCIQYAKCAYVICSNRPACHVHCRGLSTLSTPPQLVSCRVPPTTSTAARKRFHASLTDHQAVSK